MKRISQFAFILLLSFPFFLEAAANPCLHGKSASKYKCDGVTLQSRVALKRFPGNPLSASNLWGYSDPDDNREYAIIGLRNDTGVVDVTDPIRPKVVGHIPGVVSLWREVKVYSVRNKATGKWDAYAYISTEGFDGGIQIIDLSELPNRISLAGTIRDVSTSHTLFISNLDYGTGQKLPGKKPRLYVNGSNRAGLVVFSLAHPTNPKRIGEYNQTYVHDCYAETFINDDRCGPGRNSCQILFAWTGGDFRILDVSRPKSIQVLGTLVYPQLGYAHSGWVTEDKQSLFNFDELDEMQTDNKTRILTLDISNFHNPLVSGTFTGKFKSIEHNGIVIGNKLYLSHYTRGFVVMDITDPQNIRERAFFDTFPNDDHAEENAVHAAHDEGKISFHGAWGVYPFLPSGNILISDIERGLFVLKEQ
jgi:choice-of-anchor B domain-containing protein